MFYDNFVWCAIYKNIKTVCCTPETNTYCKSTIVFKKLQTFWQGEPENWIRETMITKKSGTISKWKQNRKAVSNSVPILEWSWNYVYTGQTQSSSARGMKCELRSERLLKQQIMQFKSSKDNCQLKETNKKIRQRKYSKLLEKVPKLLFIMSRI